MLNHIKDVWFKNTRQGEEFLTLLVYKGKQGKPRRSCQNRSQSVQDFALQTCTADNPAGSQAGDRGYPNQGLFSNPHTPHRCMRTHTLARAVLMGRVNLHQLLLNSNLALLPNVWYAAYLTMHMLPFSTDYWTILFLCCLMERKRKSLFIFFNSWKFSPLLNVETLQDAILQNWK